MARVARQNRTATPFTLNSTLIKGQTSFSLTSNSTNSYDSQPIYAAIPGSTVAGARRPNDRANISARLDHALTKAFTLKAQVQHNTVDLDNLGVGGFNLEPRAYSLRTDENLLRTSVSGPIGRQGSSARSACPRTTRICAANGHRRRPTHDSACRRC